MRKVLVLVVAFSGCGGVAPVSDAGVDAGPPLPSISIGDPCAAGSPLACAVSAQQFVTLAECANDAGQYVFARDGKQVVCRTCQAGIVPDTVSCYGLPVDLARVGTRCTADENDTACQFEGSGAQSHAVVMCSSGLWTLQVPCPGSCARLQLQGHLPERTITSARCVP
jgi:hypothetical protein